MVKNHPHAYSNSVMSSRNRWILFFVVVAVGAGAIIAFQYEWYRTAAPAPDASFAVGERPHVRAADILPSGPVAGGMPAIHTPSFETVWAADQYLRDAGLGIDVEVDGRRRFYPYQVLAWHGVVNDTLGGVDLAVTFCPLCQGAAVYQRPTSGDTMRLETAGKVWNGNTVLADVGTGSLWVQASGEAVDGTLAGMRLEPYPFRVVPWRRWKAAYPDGQVLRRPSAAARDYTLDPALAWTHGPALPFPVARTDVRLAMKTPVVGVQAGVARRAYAVPDTAPLGVVDDMLDVDGTSGSVPITLWFDAEGFAVVFERTLADGRVLSFFQRPGGAVEDRETGTTWLRDGTASLGPLRGRALKPVAARPMLWSCWSGAHPDTDVYALP